MNEKKFYITTPVYYVNSKPHIGHSYTQIACDVVSRFMRSRGYDVLFMTGTDEHGEKIEKTALERGFKEGEEKKLVDEIVPVFKYLWSRLNIKYDYFIRTTDEYHIRTVQAILDKLFKDGKIYKKIYNGWFCTPCETFWADSQVVESACPDCKRPVEKLDEANYFLKISEYQGWLKDYIRSNPDFIRPDFRKNEVMGFLNEELMDLCISRPKSRMGWGIEIPFDKDYVTYVWFDALINYVSGAGYPHDMERFNKYWPCDYHIIGKDIIRHHAVYWPIMLKALDIEVPRSIFAHGWWVVKGEKMSKSKGNVVDPIELIEKYGVDAYRYFLLREVPFGTDGAFSEELLISRFNSDLANDLGNLLSRTLTMVEKYFEGRVPECPNDISVSSEGNVIRQKNKMLEAEMDKSIPKLEFINALTKIWEIIGLANKYIEDSKPWTLAKENKINELKLVMNVLLEVLCSVAIAIDPFMPETSVKIKHQLNLKGNIVESGVSIQKSKPLFPRIEIKS